MNSSSRITDPDQHSEESSYHKEQKQTWKQNKIKKSVEERQILRSSSPSLQAALYVSRRGQSAVLRQTI